MNLFVFKDHLQFRWKFVFYSRTEAIASVALGLGVPQNGPIEIDNFFIEVSCTMEKYLGALAHKTKHQACYRLAQCSLGPSYYNGMYTHIKEPKTIILGKTGIKTTSKC